MYYGVFLYPTKEFSLFLFSSYRPHLGLLGVGTNQRVSRVLSRCDLGKAILKIFCVGVELSLSWSEKRDDIDAPNNDRDVSWLSTTPSRADCAPLLHYTPTTQVGKSGCSSFLLASEKTLLYHPSQIKRFTFSFLLYFCRFYIYRKNSCKFAYFRAKQKQRKTPFNLTSFLVKEFQASIQFTNRFEIFMIMSEF